MVAQRFKNTFAGGLDLDTATNSYPNDRYLDCENFRIVTKDGRATGSLEIINGQREVADLPSGLVLTGTLRIRNNIILFAVESRPSYDGTQECYIYIVDINVLKDVEEGSRILISNSYYFEGPGHLIYRGRLGFTRSDNVRGIANYENPNIQKIYFVTDGQPLRQLNIVNSTANDLRNLPVDSLSLLPRFDINPNLTLRVGLGGSLQVGTIQYFIQFFQRNGSQSSIYASTKSVLISETSARGSARGEIANRSVDITFDNTSTVFNRYRVLAADYTLLGTPPNIRIVAERELATGANSVTDSGQSVGTMTAEELNVVPPELFPKVLETKDNVLIAGNLRNERFDVDDSEFDARAYRFSSGGSCAIFNRTPSGGYIQRDVTTGNWEGVPVDHDAINRFNHNINDHTSSGVGLGQYNTYPYFFQSNGQTAGGSGPNVSYRFRITSNNLLDSVSADPRITNPSISSIPLKGYQRGEVYRFGIVFFDKKGRQSFVKWIGDIRMPLMSEHAGSATYQDASLTNVISGEVYARHIFPEFQVNIPTALRDKISGYKIVRAERTSSDRSIIATGVLSPTVSVNNSSSFNDSDYFVGMLSFSQSGDSQSNNRYGTFGTIVDYFSNTYNSNYINRTLVEFVSPEINFNKNLELSEGDFISVEGLFSNPLQANDLTTGNSNLFYSKFRGTQSDFDAVNRVRSDIEDIKIVAPIDYQGSVGKIGGDNYLAHMIDTGDEDQGAKAGTRLVCKLRQEFNSVLGREQSTNSGSNRKYMIANYKRRNDNQYSGGTYSGRLGQDYIECGEFVPVDTSYSNTDYRTVQNGDVFITMFEYLRGVWDESHGDGNHAQEVCYIPIESTINTQFKTNRFQSLLTTIEDHNREPDVYFLQETVSEGLQDFPRNIPDSSAGRYGYPEDATDLYSYNSAYSTDLNVKRYFSRPFDFQSVDTNDARIVVSDKKINNEYTDSWTIFRPNNFIDLDGRYGEIVNIVNYQDDIIGFQETGFGVLAVNQRSLIEDDNSATLALGTGGVLERFDYLNTEIGAHNRNAILKSNSNLYFIGSDNQLRIFSSRSVPLSKGNHVRSFLNATADLGDVMLGYDDENDEIIISTPNYRRNRDSGTPTQERSLAYNELLRVFNGFYGFVPSMYVNQGCAISSRNNSNIYLHNRGLPGSFYGASRIPSKISILVNPNGENVNTFDNFDISCDRIDTSGNHINESFDSIRVRNNIQTSPTIINPGDSALKQKWRTWRIVVPREVQGSRRNRMTDTHIILELEKSIPNGRFLFHDLITYYRTPMIRR